MAGDSTNSETSFRCLIAGGGTGGHLFPGVSVALELERRFKKAKMLFVVGRGKMETDIIPRYGYSVASIDVEGLKGRGWKKGVSVAAKLPKSLLQSRSIIKQFSPACVLGMGGYSAGPVCLAAKLMRIPTAIHEQNSLPGLTNRLLSRVVDRIFISFEESGSYFRGEKLILTGNPVRDELFSCHERDQRPGEPFTLLVVGGSQGARAVNEAFAEAFEYLKSKGCDLEVIHQTGKGDYDRVLEHYQQRGLQGEVLPFIQDMAGSYGRANLVVSRAGATTIFELAASRKPSILIPYPYATNQHQEINARSMVRAGGAVMIRQSDLTGKGLAQLLMKYMGDPSALEDMGRRAGNMARPDAAEKIVDQLVEMTGT